MRATASRTRWIGITLASMLTGALGACSYEAGGYAAAPPPPSEQTAMLPEQSSCPYSEAANRCMPNPSQPYYSGIGGDGF